MQRERREKEREGEGHVQREGRVQTHVPQGLRREEDGAPRGWGRGPRGGWGGERGREKGDNPMCKQRSKEKRGRGAFRATQGCHVGSECLGRLHAGAPKQAGKQENPRNVGERERWGKMLGGRHVSSEATEDLVSLLMFAFCTHKSILMV